MRVPRFRMIGSGLRALSKWRPHGEVHFSQEGEDIVLARLFSGQANGFYVDVGAHHPRRFSNSYWAYQLGWRGVNIDAAPGFQTSFARWRHRDTNVWACVSELEGDREFRIFRESALNTADADRANYVATATGSSYRSVSVPSKPLALILEEALPAPPPVIDFMTIDVEGAEMEVLRSNDWDRFRPRVVVIEVLNSTLNEVANQPPVRFLEERGFTATSMLYHSVVLVSDVQILREHWGN